MPSLKSDNAAHEDARLWRVCCRCSVTDEKNRFILCKQNIL